MVSNTVVCIHMQVALRIRPLNEAESDEGASVVAQRVDDQVGYVKQQVHHRAPEMLPNRCNSKTKPLQPSHINTVQQGIACPRGVAILSPCVLCNHWG